MSKIATLDEFFGSESGKDYSESKDTTSSLDKQFYWTGHPFVDAGLTAILLITNKEKPEELTEEDIKKAIEFVSKLYVKDDWVKRLSRIFRNNNPILMVNPSMKDKRTPTKLRESLNTLFRLIPSENESGAKCAICGRRRKISGFELRKAIHSKDKSKPKEITGDVFPLLGTGDVRNFFHSANPLGADICAYCLFLVQFMPLAVYYMGRMLIIHTFPYERMLDIHEEAIKYVELSGIASNAREFKRPENFFFKKVIEISRKIESGYRYWSNTSAVIYHFINGNRSGEQTVEIIYIPNSILRFIAFAGEESESWKKILNMGWNIKKKRKKLSFEELEKGYTNEVYRKLLNYESILPYFYNKRERNVNSSWRLLKFYCVEVLGLNEETLEFIKDVGDRIVETIEKLPNNQLRRTVRELENANKLWEFESFFVRVEKIRQNKKLPNALLTFDEFARLLTAYGEDINVSWKTVRDLLLFRIYEKLHDRLSGVEEESEEEEEFEFYRGEEE